MSWRGSRRRKKQEDNLSNTCSNSDDNNSVQLLSVQSFKNKFFSYPHSRLSNPGLDHGYNSTVIESGHRHGSTGNKKWSGNKRKSRSYSVPLLVQEQELTFLQLGHSAVHGPDNLLKHLFCSFKSLINDHPNIFFGSKPSSANIELLCYELLKCCSSNTSSVRSEAASLLYLLMRANYNYTQQVCMTQVTIQIMISVSKLISDSSQLVLLKNSRFFESLTIINCFVASDVTMESTSFPSLVRDLTKRIRNILMVSSEMKEHETDPEMLMDLQHKISDQYRYNCGTSVDNELSMDDSRLNFILRKTWLQSMARNHMKQGNVSEAASCLSHVCALESFVASSRAAVSGEGHDSEGHQWTSYSPTSNHNLSSNCSSNKSSSSLSLKCQEYLRQVSPNVCRDEFPSVSIKTQSVEPAQQSDCATTVSSPMTSGPGLSKLEMDRNADIETHLTEHFNDTSLIESLETTIKLYTKCERYEVVPFLYKLILEVYESNRWYHSLSKIHLSMASVYEKILEVTRNGGKMRLFGKYYRVAFYGRDYFGEEFTGKEFIYKEPNVTSLPEIADRLKTIFGNKFGHENIKLIMTEKEINEKVDLDPKFGYIQVNHVHPWNHVSSSSSPNRSRSSSSTNGTPVHNKGHRVSILVNDYESEREREEREAEEKSTGHLRRKSLPNKLQGTSESSSEKSSPATTPTNESNSIGSSVSIVNIGSEAAEIKYVTRQPDLDHEDDGEDRKTDFEKFQHNLNRFMFETPFSLTEPSRTHSTSCIDQCKRRTILTTEHYFPYVVKRIQVISKTTLVLSPIEVAIDEMSTRVKELNDVINGSNGDGSKNVNQHGSDNLNGFGVNSSNEDLRSCHQSCSLFRPDIKKLQLKLQGSVSVTVNAGPMSYARSFLAPESKDSLGVPFPPSKVTQLRTIFRHFLHSCSLALNLNEQLIATDQLKYHQSLKNNFSDMVNELSQYLREPPETNRPSSSSKKQHQRSTSTSTVVTISRNSSDQSIASNGSSCQSASSDQFLSNTSSGVSSSSSVVKRLSNRSVELFEKISGTNSIKCNYNTQ